MNLPSPLLLLRPLSGLKASVMKASYKHANAAYQQWPVLTLLFTSHLVSLQGDFKMQLELFNWRQWCWRYFALGKKVCQDYSRLHVVYMSASGGDITTAGVTVICGESC